MVGIAVNRGWFYRFRLRVAMAVGNLAWAIAPEPDKTLWRGVWSRGHNQVMSEINEGNEAKECNHSGHQGSETDRTMRIHSDRP